jgi:hypothetical protein
MRCVVIQDRLSEYIERSLPQEEMVQVAEHLQECPDCLGLMEEMRSVLVTCQSFPSFDAEPALVDRILLRTSGRPRTRRLKERLRAYFLQPMLTPRFAIGVGLALLFVALSVDLMMPRANTLASALSPREIFLKLDRGVQQLYSGGLKLYNAKNEWQAKLGSYAGNAFKNLGFMIEKLDVPVEGKKKPEEQKQQDKNPGRKSSVLLTRSGPAAIEKEMTHEMHLSS